jgi:hypothetical protein
MKAQIVENHGNERSPQESVIRNDLARMRIISEMW